MKLKVKIVCICLLICLLSLATAQLRSGYAVDMPSPFWRAKTPMPTARGQVAVITGDDGLVYVMGGFAGSDPPMPTVEAYDPLSEKWITKAPMLNATRGAAVAKGNDGTIYLIGGGNGTTYFATVQAYDIISDMWSLRTPIPTQAWMAGAATGDDGKVYVFGGESSVGGVFSNKTHIYDPVADSWTRGSDMPTARGMLGAVKGRDGLIYAIGGYNGSVLAVVEVYDPSTDTWSEKTPMPSPRLEFGLVLGPDKRIYAIGGGTEYPNNVGPFLDTVEVYDPNTDKWTTSSWLVSLLPTARKEFGAALGNNGKIYAIGGANGSYVNTNEEALVVLPENVPPTAYIDSITPSPATHGDTIYFVGHGADPDGFVTDYKWRSSLNGTIGTSAAFNSSTLNEGTHTVFFSVKDDSGVWSQEVAAIVTVSGPLTNESLNDQINELAQQNADLRAQVDDLTQKIDLINLELLGVGAGVVIVFVAIALTYVKRIRSMIRRRTAPKPS